MSEQEILDAKAQVGAGQRLQAPGARQTASSNLALTAPATGDDAAYTAYDQGQYITALKLAQAEAEKAVNEAQAVGQPTGPDVDPMVAEVELAMAQAQLRKANADAVTAEVKAQREQVALRSDILELDHKPIAHAMGEADLEDRFNPQAEALEPAE